MIPVTPRTGQHLIQWCDFYQNQSDIVSQPAHVRFSIGVYQISQGMSWKVASPVRWQSFCAASLHFIMSGIAFNAAPQLPTFLDEGTETFKGWEHLLLAVGKAQQQVCYSPLISAKSARLSRFNADVLSDRLTELVEQCFALVPADQRERCCFDEMNILTGDINKPVKTTLVE